MIERGEVWDADLGPVVRPVVVATRETWLINVAKDRLIRRRGSLDPFTLRRLNAALVLALGLDV